MGSERAFQLNAMYREIMNETKGKMTNFDFDYYDIPVADLMDDYAKNGGNLIDLIEVRPIIALQCNKKFNNILAPFFQPTDGFHPSGVFHALFADWIWAKLHKEHPTWIGKVNPNNAMIKEIFGEQGGY